MRILLALATAFLFSGFVIAQTSPTKTSPTKSKTKPTVSSEEDEPTKSTKPSKTNPTKNSPTEADNAAAGAAAGGLFAVGGVFCIVVVVIWFVLTFLPILIAAMRGHNNTAAIAAVTILLGWTGIGWIVALIWSFTNDTKGTDRQRYGR